jgi:cytochrome c-type biogenesis protein CcmE
MTPKKKRRLAFAAALLAAGAVVAGVVVYGLGQNTMYFRSPSDIAAKQVGEGVAFRLGGLVEKGSLRHGAGAQVQFRVTDGKSTIPAHFNGVLPALFREGQGVVATGAMDASGTFIASEVLAKHDEKYMPPEVVEALKRSGRWQEGGQEGGK